MPAVLSKYLLKSILLTRKADQNLFKEHWGLFTFFLRLFPISECGIWRFFKDKLPFNHWLKMFKCRCCQTFFAIYHLVFHLSEKFFKMRSNDNIKFPIFFKDITVFIYLFICDSCFVISSIHHVRLLCVCASFTGNLVRCL